MEEFCRGTKRSFSSAYDLDDVHEMFSTFDRYHTLAKVIINKIKKALIKCC